jgi:uncharacterized protein (TIGR04255 family)
MQNRMADKERGVGGMAERGNPIPTKLKQDAIVEAIFEVRFDTPTTAIPEIFLGRLADHQPWKGFEQRRLPASQLPAQLRQVDPNLRYQPLIELATLAKDRSVRIGPQVLSYHRLKPYVGWERFKPELLEAVDGLFAKAPGLKIQRLGLRYMNALRADVHTIKSISDLDLRLTIAGDNVPGNVNVNFTIDVSNDTQCTVRIATSEFVQGDLPPNTSVYIDVDVFTKNDFRTKDQNVVKTWIEFAHSQEKQHFFRLLPQPTIELLKEI